jgi:hypothetical protein
VIVAIEINGSKVSIYINNILLLTEDLTKPSNTGINSVVQKKIINDTLSLVIGSYGNTSGQLGKADMIVKDIKVYAGNIVSDQPSPLVVMKSVQSTLIAENKQDIRFIASISNKFYKEVGFEIIANVDGVLYEYKYSTADVYKKITAANPGGTYVEVTAESVGRQIPVRVHHPWSSREHRGDSVFRQALFHQGGAEDPGNKVIYGNGVTYIFVNGVLQTA